MTQHFDLAIRAERAIVGTQQISATVAVRDGRVALIAAYEAEVSAARTVTLRTDEVLLPGFVDSHVHVNEPGRAQWEGWSSATRAAAAGGITTIIDMPLNSSPVTTTVEALALKRESAIKSVIDFGFWGGVIPQNLGSLDTLSKAGVWGFKCFLLDSGIDEFPPLNPDQLEAAMREIARLGGLLIVHAEDAQTIDAALPVVGNRYYEFLDSRPALAELRAIKAVIESSRRTGCRAHIVHLSSAAALLQLAQARSEGVPISVETCPHYLAIIAEQVPDGATEFKCCPPIRGAANRDQLWEGIANGVIDAIVSDHSPCTPDLKHLDTGDFGSAWGGITSLQLSPAIVWTAARSRGFNLTDLSRWMCLGPASLVGLDGKGRIAVGADADFCFFAPDETFVVDAASLHHRNPVSPYDGQSLVGVARSTWLRGTQISDRSTVHAPAGYGHQLLRKDL